MHKKTRFFLVIISIPFLLSTISMASVAHFRIDIDNTEIAVGEEAIISIYAWAEGAESDNGIVSWALDIIPDTGDIVGISPADPCIVVYEPYPDFYSDKGAYALDNPLTGSVQNLGGFGFESSSEIGVGGYTLLADVTVIGLAEGTVTYSLGDDYLGDFYAGLADLTELPGQFESNESTTEITVVPEPGSLVLLALGGIYFSRKREERDQEF